MPETAEFLAERLVSEGKKTIQFLQELPEQAWAQTIYTDGAAWTVTQILAHFTTTESSLYRLLENIIGGGSGSPEDFNINAYNERKAAQLDGTPISILLEQFLQQRQQTAAYVNRLSAHDLERQGRHPFLGIAPVREIVKIIYRHNQIHQREIRRALGTAE